MIRGRVRSGLADRRWPVDVLPRKDPQPADMAHYVHTMQDNGGVHLNSGIPNHGPRGRFFPRSAPRSACSLRQAACSRSRSATGCSCECGAVKVGSSKNFERQDREVHWRRRGCGLRHSHALPELEYARICKDAWWHRFRSLAEPGLQSDFGGTQIEEVELNQRED